MLFDIHKAEEDGRKSMNLFFIFRCHDLSKNVSCVIELPFDILEAKKKLNKKEAFANCHN
jgi:hypothetical protein